MDPIEEKIIRLEEQTRQNTADIANVIKKVDSIDKNIDKNQNKTDIAITEIKGDVKAVLNSVDTLNKNWTTFDNMQKQNANKIKMQVICTTIIAMLGLVFATIKLK
jgi:seryl-tRNA synthetase